VLRRLRSDIRRWNGLHSKPLASGTTWLKPAANEICFPSNQPTTSDTRLLPKAVSATIHLHEL
jgi:hypothetical protein